MIVLIALIFPIITLFLIIKIAQANRGPKEPWSALLAAFLFGILALFLALRLEIEFVRGWRVPGVTLGVMFWTSFKVGLIEEGAKFLPLALFIKGKKYFNEYHDGIIYFAICGLTFGLFENVVYTLLGGLYTGLVRLFLTPVFHGAATTIPGFFLAKNTLEKSNYHQTLIAFLAVVLLHALYDFGLMSRIPQFVILSLLITVLLAVSIYIFTKEAIKRDLAQAKRRSP
jgi:RsiW-degrading membrane proteinase PrsW (M82 family)